MATAEPRARPARHATNGAAVHIEAVTDAAGMARFIQVPFALQGDDPNWVPPLIKERADHLNPRKNPWFDHAEAGYWLASRGGRVAGRISAQIDRARLALHGDATGHFGFLEAADDEAIFHALFGAAETWLRERGMDRALGPFSLSINDESGLLVDGFDTPPSLMMGHAPAYYGRRVEGEGYAKAMDLFAYTRETLQPLPSGPAALAERVRQRPDVTLRPLDPARYGADLDTILDVFNDAWSGNWGFVPLTAAEIGHLATSLKPLIRADLVCIAEVGGEAAAMAVALPNLNEAIADLGGRLLPLGWARLLWRLKVRGLRTARVPLMGVRRRYHGTPFGAALAFAVIDTGQRRLAAAGFEQVELSWVLENNHTMRRMIEVLGGRAYKTYRVYQKMLP